LTGTGNTQATDNAVAATIGNFESGRVSVSDGSTVNVGASLSDLENLVGGLQQANSDQIKFLATALKPDAEAADSQSKWLMAGAIIGGLALVTNLTKRR